MFHYTSENFAGESNCLFVPAEADVTRVLTWTLVNLPPEMIEGLTVGYAMVQELPDQKQMNQQQETYAIGFEDIMNYRLDAAAAIDLIQLQYISFTNI